MAFLAAVRAGRRGGLTPTAQLIASKEFNRFLTVNALAYDAEASVAWLLLEAIATAMPDNTDVPRVPNDHNALCARQVPAQGAAAGAAANAAIWNGTGVAPPALQEHIPIDAFRALVSDADKAIGWLVDLTACHQVKPLKAMNVSNYFRMTSRVTLNGREILKVLDYAAITLPNIMADAELRGTIADNQFMLYHTAYSSSAGLAQEMLDSAPAITHLFFTQATRNLINNSAANPHDRVANQAIPQQAILATYAYLEAFGKLPDNWFQGEKAKNNLPASRYNQYKAIFKRLKDLSTDTDRIAEATSIDELVGLVDPAIQNV
jgi:hypothetical protein